MHLPEKAHGAVEVVVCSGFQRLVRAQIAILKRGHNAHSVLFPVDFLTTQRPSVLTIESHFVGYF